MTTTATEIRPMPRSTGGYGSSRVRSTTAATLVAGGALKPGPIVSDYRGSHVEATLLVDGFVLLPGLDKSLTLSGAASLCGGGSVSGYEFWKASDGKQYLSIETIRRHFLDGRPRRGTGLPLVPVEVPVERAQAIRAQYAFGASERELAASFGLRRFDIRRVLRG